MCFNIGGLGSYAESKDKLDAMALHSTGRLAPFNDYTGNHTCPK